MKKNAKSLHLIIRIDLIATCFAEGNCVIFTQKKIFIKYFKKKN